MPPLCRVMSAVCYPGLHSAAAAESAAAVPETIVVDVGLACPCCCVPADGPRVRPAGPFRHRCCVFCASVPLVCTAARTGVDGVSAAACV